MSNVVLEGERLLLTHQNRQAAALYLLQRYPEGVSVRQFSDYWYLSKHGVRTCLGWQARNAIAELRHHYHIEHVEEPESRWILKGPKIDDQGQLMLGLAA